MPLSLCIATDYDQLHIALARDGIAVQTCAIEKNDGNRKLVPTIVELLAANNALLADLAYIALNVGPAPYTSLRIALVTMNGLAYATGIPLVEIDGLDLYCTSVYNKAEYPIAVMLCNAFNNDVFYCVVTPTSYTKDCSSITHLIASLAAQYPTQNIAFYGNGVILHKTELIKQFGDRGMYAIDATTYPSIDAFVQAAYTQWLHGNTTDQAHPRYLKALNYQNSVKTSDASRAP